MRKIVILTAVLGLSAILAVPCLAGDPAAILVGKWKIAPNKRLAQGSIEFRSDRTYVLKERHHDKVGVGAKGQYKLYPNKKPMGIDICLGRCGGPGSEWTTRFGIIRFISQDRAEIKTSPGKNRAKDFSGDPQEPYFMRLTRMK